MYAHSLYNGSEIKQQTKTNEIQTKKEKRMKYSKNKSE